MRTLAWIALVVLVTSPAEGQTVLSATPTSRVSSGDESTERFVLSELEQEEYRVVITARDGRYFWISREGRELSHSASGVFHWFMDLQGGGYVKVLDTHLLPDSLRDPGPRFQYMEHRTFFLGTFTVLGDDRHVSVRRCTCRPMMTTKTTETTKGLARRGLVVSVVFVVS